MSDVRKPVSACVDAVVVGAGFGGIYMIHRLREMGMTVQGIETGGGVGGTWYWNRYPGARCDVPSLFYSYSFSEELANEWRWSEKYAPQPEILEYANHVADKFDIKRSYLFNTRVTKAVFDEKSERWTVETEQGDRFEARYCIMATGCLSVPKEPDIKGHDIFKGDVYVTGRWPHEGVDFTGKRVAMIGTGSSSIQSMPLIAAQAKSVTVFQRTPNYSLPAKNTPLSDEEVSAWRAGFPAYKEMLRQGNLGVPQPPEGWEPDVEELKALAPNLWSGQGLLSLTVLPNLMRDEKVNDIAAEYVRGKIKEIVKDPALADKLTPRSFPIGSKRCCVDTDYYETYNRDNVELVDIKDHPISEITATGVVAGGKEYAVDAIVFATGFDAMTGALLRMDIRGRGGKTLREAWDGGPKTYLGLQVAGFPNLFTITGPGSPSVLSNMITSCEQHVDWIADALGYLKKSNYNVIEATDEAQEKWVAHVNEEGDRTLFPRANSWYVGANVPGKPRVFMPYVGEGYKIRCDAIAANGYEGFALSA
ncbi:MAG TPA: NAD(P)/FAD-dependent oxidoreductase [Rhizomicrobium sp.]|jgi:cyclohexanone monooxygenase|nr:NAD(P)/FAD-dependent oxidoreductase [Rhizomicrobium sp.]